MEKKGLIKKSLFSLFFLAVFIFVLLHFSQTFFVSAEVNNTTTETLPRSWIRSSAISTIAVDSERNLIYFGGTEVGVSRPLFGVYNATAETFENLSRTIGSWGSTSTVSKIFFDSVNNLVYLTSETGTGLYAVYDPSTNVTEDLNETRVGQWMGVATNDISGMAIDPLRNLAYVFNSASFGVYNRTANLTYSLNETEADDEGDWLGSQVINNVVFDNTTNLTYITGSNGLFAVYNISSNTTENLNVTAIGGWINGTTTWRDVAIDTSRNLTYISGGGNEQMGALLGVYNRTSNLTENLNITDGTGLRFSAQGLYYDVMYNPNDTLVYFSGGIGAFGFYNRSDNTTYNLNATDPGNWVVTPTLASLTLDTSNGLVYLFSGSKFGVYNRTSNVTENLNDTDTGNWLSTNSVNDLEFNPVSGLIYLGGASGVIGHYNRTANVTTDLNLPNDWVRFNNLNSLLLTSIPHQIFFGGALNTFGYYNKTDNNKTDLRDVDIGNFLASSSINDMVYDPDEDLIYVAGSSPSFFGVYNISTNITANLTNLDASISDAGIQDFIYNQNDRLLYMFQSTRLLTYNLTLNQTADVTYANGFGWQSIPASGRSMFFNSSENRIYFTSQNSVFGYYDVGENITIHLNTTDVANWFSTSSVINSVTQDSANSLLYIVGNSGLFGVYDFATNETSSLNVTDAGNWIGTSIINSITYDSNRSLVFFGGASGVFGVYNRTSNISEDLRATDSGDWIGSSAINKVLYDSTDDIVYLAGNSGVFGYYNRTVNSSTPITIAGGAATTTEDTGGSGSGGSFSTETASFGDVSRGGSSTVSITDPGIDIRNITITAKRAITNGSVTVSTDTTVATTFVISSPLGTVYQSFNINPVSISNSQLSEVSFDFRVNKTWLSENNYTYNDVILYRKPTVNGNWQELPTASITEDETYYYFTSTSPGFSTFTIFVRKLPCDIGALRCFNNEVQLCIGNTTWVVTESCSGSCVLGKCTDGGLFGETPVSIKSVFFYAAIILAVSATIVFVFVRLRRNLGKKEKRKKRK